MTTSEIPLSKIENRETTRVVTLSVNGVQHSVKTTTRTTLAEFLREDLRLTGTHVGCAHGVCGACTVMMDGQSVRSCLMFAVQAHGHDVLTVEGLSKEGELAPLQVCFRAHHALQCGYCTAGFLMTLTDFLSHNPDPTEEEVRQALTGNLCRCTGYTTIVEAALDAATRMRAKAEVAA
jgi:aerobic-type carbon monoxide dehydrogenase small subunit (CoxS/CutS family)